MLQTKYLGDNLKMLVTVFTILVTNIQKIEILPSTSKNGPQLQVTNITVTEKNGEYFYELFTRGGYLLFVPFAFLFIASYF